MKTLVLVPTYNERENIPILVKDILQVPGTVVMVLDDQSPDGTGAVADALAGEYPGRVQVLHRTGQRGLGVSYLEGFQRAIASDADFVVQMDADLSHDPKYLPELIRMAAAGADLVIGSRYLNGISVVNWPLRRIILSSFANFYIRTVTGLGPARHHHRLSLLAARRRSRGCRSTRSSRRATPSCSTSRSWPPTPACGSRSRRSSSSSAGRAPRSCRAACCSNRCSRRGS